MPGALLFLQKPAILALSRKKGGFPVKDFFLPPVYAVEGRGRSLTRRSVYGFPAWPGQTARHDPEPLLRRRTGAVGDRLRVLRRYGRLFHRRHANQPVSIAVGVMVLALLLSLVMIQIEKELPEGDASEMNTENLSALFENGAYTLCAKERRDRSQGLWPGRPARRCGYSTRSREL